MGVKVYISLTSGLKEVCKFKANCKYDISMIRKLKKGVSADE